MAVETDSVAESMREEFVAGAVAGGGHDCAGGIVDGAGQSPGASRIECGILRVAQRVEDFDELVGWLAAKTTVRVTSD